jgi:hypothetical protein
MSLLPRCALMADHRVNLPFFSFLIKYNLGDPGADVRIILRWILRKWEVGIWTGSSWLRIGTSDEHL